MMISKEFKRMVKTNGVSVKEGVVSGVGRRAGRYDIRMPGGRMVYDVPGPVTLGVNSTVTCAENSAGGWSVVGEGKASATSYEEVEV